METIPMETERTIEQASLPTTIYLRTSLPEQTSVPPPSTTDAISILLDPQEEELFQLLVKVADAFAAGDIDLEEWQMQPETRPSHVLIRVAGGWVRDKVVQEYGGSYDVDLAVQHMTGVQLAKLIQMYVQKTYDNAAATDINNKDGAKDRIQMSRRMGIIAANPAQSKHLETATFRLCGIDMDLCNLRANEVYTDDSRIPTVRLGTPLEDALRRDFTVNALFYNLHSRQVEDWTGRAVRDLLETKLLVTPLEPVQTFRDDPLRILRAVRFAVRLQLSMDVALQDAARLPEIRHALAVKVSRERFGKELEGMLSGKNARPLEALKTIFNLGLTSIVFCLPETNVDKIGGIQGRVLGELFDPSNETLLDRTWSESEALLTTAASLWERCTSIMQEPHSINKRLLPLAIILSPLRNLQYYETKKPDRLLSVVEYIMRESIKFKKDDAAAMVLLTDHVDSMIGLLEQNKNDNVTRLQAGMLLRSVREYWPTALMFAAVLKTRQDESLDWVEQAGRLFQKIASEYSLDECWKITPLLNGKVLQKTFGKGPTVGLYMQEQIRWMLANPHGNADECLNYLKGYEPDSALEEPKQKKAHINP